MLRTRPTRPPKRPWASSLRSTGAPPLIYTLLAAALGWVTWNMAGPALNQLDNMQAKNSRKSR